MLPWKFLLAVLVLFGSCAKKEKNEENSGPDKRLALTLSPDKRTASKYCGDKTPPIPENPVPPYRFERSFLNEKLQGEGLTGWIHGAVASYRQYVFTYRKEDPDDFMAFFKAEQFSLIPTDDQILKLLSGLKRHDKVRLHGRFFQNASPLGHLMVTSVEILERFELATDNSYTFDLRRLKGLTTFEVFGIVHAIIESQEHGRAIVVEHEDLLFPMAVPKEHAKAAAKLYRGDIVNVSAKMSEKTHSAPHVSVDEKVANAIDVIDPMLNCHGKETVVSGHLAKFNKSPAIKVDVYAIRYVDANGIARNYTLFPDSEDPEEFNELFSGLSLAAKTAWEESREKPRVVRNFLEKKSVKISVKGRINVVSTEQANAQVYIKDVADIEFSADTIVAK